MKSIESVEGVAGETPQIKQLGGCPSHPLAMQVVLSDVPFPRSECYLEGLPTDRGQSRRLSVGLPAFLIGVVNDA
jgi:hypothetical protein